LNSDEIFPDMYREEREVWKGKVSHLHNIKDQPSNLFNTTEIWSMVTSAKSIEQ